jgi:hypothetical protein
LLYLPGFLRAADAGFRFVAVSCGRMAVSFFCFFFRQTGYFFTRAALNGFLKGLG